MSASQDTKPQNPLRKPVTFALIAALLVTVGMFAGFRLNQSISYQSRQQVVGGVQKFEEAMWFVKDNYVEDPNPDKMVDDAIVGMLDGLDPHSYYIPKEEMVQMEEQMQGSFEGIGVEFNIIEDTLYVVTAISGGPSERVGIQAGDRIVKVNGENIAGVKITNTQVFKYLRGPKGTHVKVSVVRPGTKKLLEFDITRDQIPLYSVDYSYMVRPQVGYIKVSRFAETTHQEFAEHLYELKNKGMESLILDLRGNPGGYLEMAQRIADEFLPEGRMIVYTEGRTRESKAKYRATSIFKAFEKGALIVLIDYGSASASEIVSGAVQDWDRGLIMGVRSFGKGMVQIQHQFKDTSAIRIVISKYYTPMGRCIQKPYNKSHEEYEKEIEERFESGEIYDESKIKLPDSLKFKTNSGRTVYGGGAIMPDVFVPRDTSSDSDYLIDLVSANLFNQYAFKYHDQNPNFTTVYKTADDFQKKFVVTEGMLTDFSEFAASREVAMKQDQFARSKKLISNLIKAYIGRQYWKDDGFYPVVHETDNVLQKAIEYLPAAKELEKSGKFTPIK